ncbi:hypothetical protein J1N35_028951 [Gossypium stocksii]|uniref:Uncharacterized protein n=1 Tax=Gossypium stocksii TaxID=47602 RepID=A0A9D3UYW1_9ROSI|nr:hypothetical protein J1N35_028951 [Gossypium stocksii]
MSKLSKLKAQITEVKGIMMDNIEKIRKSDDNDFSPGRSPGSSRLQLGTASGVSRLRSPSLKKPPEPLRRAVADCLSSSSSSSFSPAAGAGGLSSYHHGSQLVLNEASRTLWLIKKVRCLFLLYKFDEFCLLLLLSQVQTPILYKLSISGEERMLWCLLPHL